MINIIISVVNNNENKIEDDLIWYVCMYISKWIKGIYICVACNAVKPGHIRCEQCTFVNTVDSQYCAVYELEFGEEFEDVYQAGWNERYCHWKICLNSGILKNYFSKNHVQSL